MQTSDHDPSVEARRPHHPLAPHMFAPRYQQEDEPHSEPGGRFQVPTGGRGPRFVGLLPANRESYIRQTFYIRVVSPR